MTIPPTLLNSLFSIFDCEDKVRTIHRATEHSLHSSTSRDSTGFSRDVCAVLLIANITRCFFWIGNHFELGKSLHHCQKRPKTEMSYSWPPRHCALNPLMRRCSPTHPVHPHDPRATRPIIHLHPLQTNSKPRSTRNVDASAQFLAVAPLCAVHRVPRGVHVSYVSRIASDSGSSNSTASSRRLGGIVL